MRELVRMLKSSKATYERAYDKTRNKGLHDLYGALASTHIPMIGELENELAHLEMLGTTTRTVRKTILGDILKDMREPAWLLGDDGMLRMIYSTERRLLSMYDRHLLKPDLLSSMGELLSRQRAQVELNVKDIELFLTRNTSMA